jgi:hypothetical protein
VHRLGGKFHDFDRCSLQIGHPDKSRLRWRQPRVRDGQTLSPQVRHRTVDVGNLEPDVRDPRRLVRTRDTPAMNRTAPRMSFSSRFVAAPDSGDG